LQADQDAIVQAQRAIDENDLAIRATAERAAADQRYAADVKRIQTTRAEAEAEMNEKLSVLSGSFQNGAGSVSALAAIAAEYGIQIGVSTIPDFNNLSSASNALVDAFSKLNDYIAQATGTTATPISVSGGGPYNPTSTPLSTLGVALATYTQSGGSVYYQSHAGQYGSKPLLAGGGIVMPRLGGVDVTVAERGIAEAIVPLDSKTMGGMVFERGSVNINGAIGNPEEIALRFVKEVQILNGRGMRFGLK
jgi:hypothetical protein